MYSIIYLYHYGIMDICLYFGLFCFKLLHWPLDFVLLAPVSPSSYPITVAFCFVVVVIIQHTIIFWHYKMLLAHIAYFLIKA